MHLERLAVRKSQVYARIRSQMCSCCKLPVVTTAGVACFGGRRTRWERNSQSVCHAIMLERKRHRPPIRGKPSLRLASSSRNDTVNRLPFGGDEVERAEKVEVPKVSAVSAITIIAIDEPTARWVRGG